MVRQSGQWDTSPHDNGNAGGREIAVGSVEHDERLYDGGGATQAQIDAEQKAARDIAERRVEGALLRRDQQTVEWATDLACDGMATAVRLWLIGDVNGAHYEFARICKLAQETLVDIELRSVTAQEIAEEME